MAVSATAARVYINVPDALNQNQATLDATFAGVKGLNATAVRIPVSWKSVQPTQPDYFKWDTTDLAVNRAVAAGLRILLVLSPPKPYWAASVDPTRFAAFAGAVALRYKGKVAEYQVWDEPNIAANWPGKTQPNADEYAAVLRASSTAIKKADTAALVVFGGLRACKTTFVPGSRGIKTAIEPTEYLSEIFSSIGGSFDILAYHPYSIGQTRPPSGDTIAQYDRLYQSMSGRGLRGSIVAPNKKVYWTAFGYDMAVFTNYQQALYLDTLRWLAQTRPEVTGLGVYAFRDFLA